ncbi:hypothetical protein ScPMuIL_011420 [Solemya velum]
MENPLMYSNGIALAGEGTPSATTLGQQPGLTNINIANITSLPQNINIQNLAGLQGMNIGLQNMQVSLTGVPGGIAVPITMINSSPVQTGILVSSLSNLSSSSVTTPGSATLSSSTGSQANTTPALVTMVTALPSTSTSTSVSSTGSQVVGAPAGVVSPTGMLSLPINLAGNLTQFMPTGLKQQTAGGLRTQTSLPLLQLQGQQGIQLLNLQQRSGLKAPTATLQPTSQTAGKLGTTVTSGIPATTGIWTGVGMSHVVYPEQKS